jgi:glycine cleavage system aminomethyltransferase T
VLRYAPDDGSVRMREVTSAFGVLTLAGPSSRMIAQRLSHTDLSGTAFAYMTAQRIDLGHAPVLALRAGYVGELGWEFHVPVEYVRDLYDRLAGAGADAGLRDVGYRAVNSLRLEKQYVAWAADVRSDDNPYAGGLGFAVRPEKPGLLAGPALRKIRDEGPAERLCWFSADADVVMHGGELLTHLDHDCAASVRSAGFGYTVGRTIFSAYLPADIADATVAEAAVAEAAVPQPAAGVHEPAAGGPELAAGGPEPAAGVPDLAAGGPARSGSTFSPARRFVVEVAGERFAAVRDSAPLSDPAGARVRG